MRWLRQQARVESLAARLQQNRRLLSCLAMQFKRRANHRLRQPSTLAWAFGVGILFGLNDQGRRKQPNTDLLPILNSALALWSLLANTANEAKLE